MEIMGRVIYDADKNKISVQIGKHLPAKVLIILLKGFTYIIEKLVTPEFQI